MIGVGWVMGHLLVVILWDGIQVIGVGGVGGRGRCHLLWM